MSAKMGSTITGLENFGYCLMTDEELETYESSVSQFAESMSIKVEPNISEDAVYTDNAESETAGGSNGAAVEIKVKALIEQVQAKVFGHSYDTVNGGVMYGRDDTPKYFAFHYTECYNDGTKRHIWLLKIKLNETGSTIETQGKEKKLQTPDAYKGTAAMRKRDGHWMHYVWSNDANFKGETDYFSKPWEPPTAIAVTSIALSESALSLVVGATQELAITWTPTGATNKNVTWFSTDTTKATVDQNGKVTAIAAGSVTITAVTNDGNKTASCVVTVTAS